MLYCPNYTCQTPNLETNKFCQKCRTLLPKHYLWTIGDGIDAYQVGDLIANRYLHKGSQILLDTKPGLYPSLEEEIPEFSMPYLRLSPYQIHVPQVYDWISTDPNHPASKLVLLEQSAVYVPLATAGSVAATNLTAIDSATPANADHLAEPYYILPTLSTVWPESSALRQLNWLWQIAQLWLPLSTEQVASTLLMSDLLRVEGALVRLLELYPDSPSETVTLVDLGKLWQRWVPTAHPTAAPVMESICQALIQGKLHHPDELIAHLDHGLATVDRGHTRQITLTTQTDQGPSRHRNEDACYPASGTMQASMVGETSTAASPLVIVCDGIGGHQGGDVASSLAIAAVYQHLQAQPLATLTAAELTYQLEAAACIANDLISQRNDDEQRQDRQRMGTTLVIGLVRQHELYITHVGDSRAYWITRWGCHQVTVDDDVASREVRMGYSFYREALQHPSSGSLVQALGMSTSSFLHPTVQRFILDDDSIFLLCTDGLSDNDRVEQYWDSAILPVIAGSADLETTRQRLVEIANTQNGHDNVTIGLIHCRVLKSSGIQYSSADDATVLPPTRLVQPRSPQPNSAQILSPQAATVPTSSTLRTKLLPTKAPASASEPRLLSLLFKLVLLLGLGGALAYILSASVRNWVDPILGLTTSPTPLPLPSNGTVIPAPPLPLQPGTLIQIGRSTTNTPNLILSPSPDGVVSTTPVVPNAAILPGSVLQIVAEDTTTPNRWLKLRLCSSGSTTSGTAGGSQAVTPPANGSVEPSAVVSPTLAPGAEGWIKQKDLEPLALSNPNLTPEQKGTCVPSNSPVPISPSAPPIAPPPVPVAPPSTPTPTLTPIG